MADYHRPSFWQEPPPRSDEASSGWLFVAVVALAGGFLVFILSPPGHLGRIAATVLPVTIAAVLAMGLWRVVSLPLRLAGVAAAVLLAVPAFLFIPTANGVNYWTARCHIAELQDAGGDTAELKRCLDRCQLTLRDFPEVNSAIEQSRRDWVKRKLKEVDGAIFQARRGKAAEARRTLDLAEVEFAAMRDLDNMKDAYSRLADARRIVKEWQAAETLLPRLEALEGKDRAGFRQLREELSQLTGFYFTDPELGQKFREAEQCWAGKAATAVAAQAEGVARDDKLTEADALLAGARQQLASTPMVTDTLNAAADRALETVWRQRVKALAAVPPGDYEAFRKQRQQCLDVLKSFPRQSPALTTQAEMEWIDKSARAAAAQAEALIRQAKFDETQRLLTSARQELSEVGMAPGTDGQKTLQQSFDDLSRARLQQAVQELKSLLAAKKFDDISLLAVQLAQGRPKEAAVSAFVQQCADIVATEDCRAVEELLAEGKTGLDAAVGRMKELLRSRADLLKLAGASKAAADYQACRRKVVQAHLDSARRQFDELEAAGKHAEAGRTAQGLRRAWQAEANAVGAGDELGKLMAALADRYLRPAIEQAEADLKQTKHEPAFHTLQFAARDWIELETHKSLTAARQRVASAILADARTRLVALVEAEDYAAVLKLKQGLEQKKELGSWGAGPALQAFMRQCAFLLDVARSAGKLPKQ